MRTGLGTAHPRPAALVRAALLRLPASGGRGGFSVESCGTYFLAEELLTLPQAILLVVMLAGVMIEERRL
ncbi:MAG: hypothetical protein ACLUEK_01790 [Oscillospiraceae bacterium]